MYFQLERIERILKELQKYIYSQEVSLDIYRVKECDYNSYELLKEEGKDWNIFKRGDRWGGKDKHFWFKTQIVIPENFEGKTVVYKVSTGREDQWDALNPQFLSMLIKH